MSSTSNNDPLGYVDDLRSCIDELPESITCYLPGANFPIAVSKRWDRASKSVELNQEQCLQAALAVSNLGFCRLYGIALPPDLERLLCSPLPPELLVPAIDYTLRMLDSADDNAEELPGVFDNDEPIAAEACCKDLLHNLMENWASFEVINTEYQYSLNEGGSSAASLGVWMRRLLDASGALEETLQQPEQIRLLSTVTGSPLPDNLRKMLAEPYRDPLPWWLDGTLEAAAEEVRKSIETDRTFEPTPGN